MSFWIEALRGFQKAAILNDKVERALKAAEDAKQHSTENRDRIIAIETLLNFGMPQPGRTPRLPRR